MRIIFLFTLILSFTLSKAQTKDALQTDNKISPINSIKKERNRKGNLFIYWGWNKESYSKSDIRFLGVDYDFILQDVIADDRQSKFGFDTYLNPSKATIPQYNFRIGYFFKHNYSISLGIDHMKYVVRQNQTLKITGHIGDINTGYMGDYSGNNIILKPDFLKYEHTDGLNFINMDIRRFDHLYTYGLMTISATGGLGAGVLVPRSDVTLLGKPRHDEFHVSGYGISIMAGINISFWNHFFIQTEYKGGYINLPDVQTTYDTNDSAKQSFVFGQYNIVFGSNILL